MLYNIYVADIPNPIYGDTANIIFADDITQIVVGQQNHIQNKVLNEIYNINDFEIKWKIKTNIDKFKIIQIGGPRRNRENYRLNNQHYIDATLKGKFLGYTLYNDGVKREIKEKAIIGFNRLSKIKRFYGINKQQKRTLYLSLIRSAMIYPISPWLTGNAKTLTKIQMVQNRAARFINSTEYGNWRAAKEENVEADLIPLNQGSRNCKNGFQ